MASTTRSHDRPVPDLKGRAVWPVRRSVAAIALLSAGLWLGIGYAIF